MAWPTTGNLSDHVDAVFTAAEVAVRAMLLGDIQRDRPKINAQDACVLAVQRAVAAEDFSDEPE